MRMWRQLTVTGFIAALTLAIAVAPVPAAQVDCALAACNFGATEGSAVQTDLSTGQWNANVTAQAYQNAGVYTYVYQFHLLPGLDDISSITIASVGAPNVNLFSNALNWGVITDFTSAAVSAAFSFGVSSFRAFPGDLGPNPGGALDLTFYAQATVAPGAGSIAAVDGGTSDFGPTIAPNAVTSVPEPSTLLLIGAGTMLSAPWLRGRNRKRNQDAHAGQ